MTIPDKHPEDFGPYLDRDFSDNRYGEIAEHIKACRTCTEEIRSWQTIEGMFRDADLEIEVPAFQWARIKAQLAVPAPAPRAAGWLRSLFGRPGWAAAAGLLVCALTLTGVGYQKFAERSQLRDLAQFSVGERQRLVKAENPFRSDDESNPFARIQDYADVGNPFATR
jgi:anti-sigma factor RsiW